LQRLAGTDSKEEEEQEEEEKDNSHAHRGPLFGSSFPLLCFEPTRLVKHN